MSLFKTCTGGGSYNVEHALIVENIKRDVLSFLQQDSPPDSSKHTIKPVVF